VKIKPIQDNVFIRFLPEPEMTTGGLFIPQNAQTPKRNGVRRAEVLAVGPGYYRDNGHGRFIPTTLEVGEIVLVDALAGQDYRLDLNVPRHNKSAEWTDKHGEMRCVREEEVLCVIEEE